MVKNIFARFDVNNKNIIDHESVKKALVQLNITNDEYEDVIKIIDEKYDGDVSLVNFCKLVYVLLTANFGNPYSVLYHCASDNCDGNVTIESVANLI